MGIDDTITRGAQMRLQDIHAVVVDDSKVTLDMIEGMARGIGLDAMFFLNPLKALDYIRNNPVDIVLTDYIMPEMDGLSLVREIRKVHSDIPIIMVTIVSDAPGLCIEALEAGATDFLTKPLNIPEFRARVENMIALRRFHLREKMRGDLLEEDVRRATAEVVRREHETLNVLSRAAEYRDCVSDNHTLRMGQYSRIVAQGLGLDDRMQDLIFHAAPLHDVGKIGISDSILLKPERLTSVEFEIVKNHTTIGYEIMKDRSSPYINAAAIIALSHHEKYDGSGYPYGLKGDNIPLKGRITAVVDVFDVLTSRRPYKEPWTFEDAIKVLEENSGTHFDLHVLEAFMENMEKIRDIFDLLSDHVLLNPPPGTPENRQG